MRTIVIVLGIAVAGFWSSETSGAIDLVYGCCSRPACGKVCKLVCGKTKLTAVGYGCECKEICLPGPNQPGCKHCETRCCCDSDIKGCRPKLEFCWYDWFACGCARPRTIHVLTKYQAEKEVPSFHWEVVDACDCCCPSGSPCVYKEAPPEAQVGQALELTEDEQVQVASYMSASESIGVVSIPAMTGPTSPPADATANASADEATAAKPAAWQRLTKVFSSSDAGK